VLPLMTASMPYSRLPRIFDTLILHRCLQRLSISRLPQVGGKASTKRKCKTYPIGQFHFDIAEIRTG
jgi:hypothetical protein